MDENMFRDPVPFDCNGDLKEEKTVSDDSYREDNDLPDSAFIDNASGIFNFPLDAGKDIKDVAPLKSSSVEIPSEQSRSVCVRDMIDEIKDGNDEDPTFSINRLQKNKIVILVICIAVFLSVGFAVFLHVYGGKSTSMPETTEQIADFYKAAANRLTKKDEAGYVMTDCIEVSDFNLTGVDFVDNILNGLFGTFDRTGEDDSTSYVHVIGAEESPYQQFPDFSLADYSHIISAECTPLNNNYYIKMVFEEETDPLVTGFLMRVTDIYPYEFVIEYLKSESPQIKEYSDVHIIYSGVTIEAEITPTGELVSARHIKPADLDIGSIKIGWFTFKNKHMHFNYSVEYNEFEYHN